MRAALVLVLALPGASAARAGAAPARLRQCCCRARVFAKERRSGGERDDEPTLAAKGAWYAAELVGNLAARTRGRPAARAQAAQAGAPRTLREAISRLEADYARRYFIIGAMDEALYADDCEFADPFTSFRGRDRFVSNLANLAGGFITDSRVRTLSASAAPAAPGERIAYTTRLLVKLQLALPWRPLLAWVWGVTHEVDPETLLVVRHVESWEVSPAEGVRQLFTPGPARGLDVGTQPPQPSGSATQARPQLDPVLGPLVRVARSSGLLRPEADGWEGEPSAWARPDSLAQRASLFAANRLRSVKQAIVDAAAGDFDPARIDARIAAESASAPVFLYSFSTCPFCKRAKEILDQEGARFTALELDVEPDGPAIRARLGRLTGRTSMPAIWVGGEYVGGCNDGPADGPPGIAALAQSGALLPKLRKARALDTRRRA